jgi:hypothetical protein
MHVRTQVTSVNTTPLGSPQQQLDSLCTFRTSKSYLLSHTLKMSDPPNALFILDKSITNEVSTFGLIAYVPDANEHSISTLSSSAPTMATTTRAGTSGSQPIPTTTCPHYPKSINPLRTRAVLNPLSQPPSSRHGSERRPRIAQSGCRQCRAPRIRTRRSMSSTRL